MARSLGPRWNGYMDGVAVRSGTGDIFNKSKAAGIQVDSAASYALKFNSNGTVRTLVDLALAQTLTNKTLTAPVLGGSVTGVYTLAGTPTITSPAITGGTISAATFSANIENDTKVLAASATFTTNSVLASLTGLSWTLVTGATYQYDIDLYTTQTTNGGLNLAFKLTTAVLASIVGSPSQAVTGTASQLAQVTNTADQSSFVNNKTAAYTRTSVSGTFVVTTGGTFALQAAQNTSNSDTTTIALGSYARVTRVL